MAMLQADKEELIRLLAKSLHFEASGSANRWAILDRERHIILTGASADDTLTTLVRKAAEKLAVDEKTPEPMPKGKRKG